jgi:hypothetical protein
LPDSLKMIHGELLSFLLMFSVLRLENTGMNFDRVQCREGRKATHVEFV